MRKTTVKKLKNYAKAQGWNNSQVRALKKFFTRLSVPHKVSLLGAIV